MPRTIQSFGIGLSVLLIAAFLPRLLCPLQQRDLRTLPDRPLKVYSRRWPILRLYLACGFQVLGPM